MIEGRGWFIFFLWTCAGYSVSEHAFSVQEPYRWWYLGLIGLVWILWLIASVYLIRLLINRKEKPKKESVSKE